MAIANDFSNPRLEDAHYVDGSHWEFATTGVPDQRREKTQDLDGRAAWFPHFRLYSPKRAFLDRAWISPDLEKVQ
jgi:hypothetical protein